MLHKKQTNDLFSLVVQQGFIANDFIIDQQINDRTSVTLIKHKLSNYYFNMRVGKAVTQGNREISVIYLSYTSDTESVIFNPTKAKNSGFAENWQLVKDTFSHWLNILKEEQLTPDLWAEAAKTAQLFAPTSTPTDDKFTRTELAEVQGQLRLLQQSFATAALPEAARQKLIELTQTAAVKAEGLTKKDWQNWIIGGFISAIASCALNPIQAAEVLKLVKAAFGGLFLH